VDPASGVVAAPPPMDGDDPPAAATVAAWWAEIELEAAGARAAWIGVATGVVATASWAWMAEDRP